MLETWFLNDNCILLIITGVINLIARGNTWQIFSRTGARRWTWLFSFPLSAILFTPSVRLWIRTRVRIRAWWLFLSFFLFSFCLLNKLGQSTLFGESIVTFFIFFNFFFSFAFLSFFFIFFLFFSSSNFFSFLRIFCRSCSSVHNCSSISVSISSSSEYESDVSLVDSVMLSDKSNLYVRSRI